MVWFITGASKGLGLSLIKELLQAGHKVAATSRSLSALTSEVAASANFLPLAVDLTDVNAIREAVKKTHDTLGGLDVVVNNAGYGIGGAVEELNDKEIYQAFDVNVFATIHVIQAALPYLRAQRSGHIINISSIAGFAPSPGWPMYSATKYAVIGLSESLAVELKPLGINVTAVAPGGFRTEFLTSDSLVLAENKIEDYHDTAAGRDKFVETANKKQIGDPVMAARVFMTLAETPEPPVLLFIGSDAHRRATAKVEQLAASLENYKELTLSTDYK
jgi:NAD(P)-dependent dehydrogenase (short-subunit alcohol dehydrogenase family)